MDKSRLIVLGIFLVSLFSVSSVFAQDSGCCLNIDAGSDFICKPMTQSSCAASGEGAQFFQNSCNDIPTQDCQKVCNVCSGNGQTKNVWEYRGVGCSLELVATTFVNVDEGITTEQACVAATSTPVQNLPDVSGKVTDAGLPVSGATVSCTGKTTTSDASGNYQLVDCQSIGQTTILASKGTKSGSAQVVLADGDNKGGVNIPLTSASTASVTVIVKDAETTATITDASVTITGESGFSATDVSAPYQFSLVPVGVIRVTATKTTYAQGVVDSSTTSAGTTITVNLEKKQTTTLSGTVFNLSSSDKVSGAAVDVVHFSGNQRVVDATTTTDSNGIYSLTVPIGANYIIEVRKTGFGTYSEGINFEQSVDYTTHNIFLSTPSAASVQSILTINVRNAETDALIDNAFIRLRSQNEENNADLYTNAGIASTNIANGAYTVFVNHPDYEELRTAVTITGDRDLSIELVPIQTIIVSGTVYNTSNRPLVDATISVLSQNYKSVSGGSFSFTHKVSPNLITVYFRAPGHITETRTIPANRDTNLAFGQITLTPSLCNDASDAGVVDLFNPSQSGKQVSLGWQAPCSPQKYKIFRNSILLTVLDDTTILNYADTSVIEQTEYCYVVQADYEFNGVITSVQSSSKCVTVGDAVCFDGDKQFCDGNNQMQCENGVLVATPCPTGNICFEKSGTTQCIEPKRCDLCNRPFGVFSKSFSGTSFFGGKGFDSPLFSYKTGVTPIFSCSQAEVPCYEDYSSTISNKNYACNQVKSCYDYVSEDACTANKCLQTSEECEWIPSQSYDELGIGVCRPRDAEKQSCAAFNERSDIANDVFGSQQGSVGREVCSLYADSCYYKQSDQSCLDASEVSCADYADIADCLGPNANNPGAQQTVDADVLWATSEGFSQKIQGTNQIVSRSNDYFNTGLCKFIDVEGFNGCMKDADDNQDTGDDLILENNGFDCSINDKNCLLDTVPPQTFIDSRPFSNKVDFNYSVIDESGSEGSSTWFSVASEFELSEGVYPTSNTISSGGRIATNNIWYDGVYAILFFSEDVSHNLEIVKRLDVTIDTKTPYIAFDKSVEPDLANKRVTLTATLSLPDVDNDGNPNDELAYCVKDSTTGLFLLRDINGVEYYNNPLPMSAPTESTLGLSVRDEWHETYANIVTGSNQQSGIEVRYAWKCFDRAGNVFADSVEFTLDADMTLFDPQPSEAIKEREGIEISIKSQLPGECRYSENPSTQFEQRTPFTNTAGSAETLSDGQRHSSIISVTGTNNRRFNVACRLEGIEGTVYGSQADDISVTIDDLPPTTIVKVDGKEYQPSSGTIWLKDSALDLECLDRDLPFVPSESGCGTVFACVGAGCTPTAFSVAAHPQIESSTAISYYSEDVLGNRESPTKTQQVKFDNIIPALAFTAPFNGDYYETKDGAIVLKFNITNHGPNDCVRSATCDVSPLLDIGTAYALYVGAKQERNETMPIIDVEAEKLQMTKTIALITNAENKLFIRSKDIAGNIGPQPEKFIKVIQDSVGPNLTAAQFKRVLQSGGSSDILSAEYGSDFTIQIENVADLKPGSGFASNRVSAVWIQDMFGANYQLQRTGASWTGTIPTRKWLVSAQFPTYFIVFANDTLDNVAQRKINITIADTTPPSATVTAENKYGEELTALVKGQNHIVVKASESLANISASLLLLADGKEYPLVFTARDFDATTWIATVDIKDTITDFASITGQMTDANGISSSLFIPDTLAINAKDIAFPVPASSALDGSTYVVGQQNMLLEGLDEATYEYQFVVNGKPQELINGRLALEPGQNTIEIRMEDAEGNYYTTTQTVSLEVPYPQAPTELTEDAIVPAFTLSMPSVINAQPLLAEVSVTNEDYVVGSLLVDGVVRSTNLVYLGNNKYAFKEALDISPGTHTVSISLRDENGNEHTESSTITVDKQSPALDDIYPIYSGDLVKNISGVFTTKQQTISFTGGHKGDFNSLYVVGEDKKIYTLAELSATSFRFEGIALVGQTFTEQQNTFKLVFRDAAGNIAEKTFVLVKDLRPPQLIQLAFQRRVGIGTR